MGAGISCQVTLNDPEKAVYKVAYYANDQLIGESAISPYSFIWEPETGGNYDIHAVAYDLGDSTHTTSKRSVSVNSLPEISFTSLQGGQVFDVNDTIQVAVSASDDIGVTSLELLIGNSSVDSSSSSSISYTIDPPHSVGKMTIKAIATDSEAQKGEKAIVLTINDGGTSVPNLAAASFTVYPNPARNVISISGLPEGNRYGATIFSLNGTTLLTETINAIDNNPSNIDILSLQTGLYLIEIKNEAYGAINLFIITK
ncbi:MAG: T9SS type A sorting domain-containing protein [Bacteroidales bacterium]|nr:T9SS type A sorting domain-containing protein [Bacteroidales bacterium]